MFLIILLIPNRTYCILEVGLIEHKHMPGEQNEVCTTHQRQNKDP